MASPSIHGWRHSACFVAMFVDAFDYCRVSIVQFQIVSLLGTRSFFPYASLSVTVLASLYYAGASFICATLSANCSHVAKNPQPLLALYSIHCCAKSGLVVPHPSESMIQS